MNSYPILFELIKKLEVFEKRCGGEAMVWGDFVDFLVQDKKSKDNKVVYFYKSEKLKTAKGIEKEVPKLGLDIERVIAQLLVFMYRYAKIYSKIILTNTVFNSLDEFTYCGIVFQFERLTKMELITKSIHEKPSGIEIINRLCKKGILKASKNKQDGRSQYIELTPMGRKKFIEAAQKMDSISKIVSGKLEETEKHQLGMLLKKLDDFHDHYLPVFKREANEGLK